MPRPRRPSVTRSGTRSATSPAAPWIPGHEPHRPRAPGGPDGPARGVGALGVARQPAPLRAALSRPAGAWPGTPARGVPDAPHPPRRHRPRDPDGLPPGRGPRPRARLRARAPAPRRRDLRAPPRRALRDPERRVVPVADALLRTRPSLEDRLRRAPRVLPRRAGRP